MKRTLPARAGRWSVLVPSVLAVSLALSGCGQTGSGFAILDGPADSGDTLPPGAFDGDLVREGSARFLAEVPTDRGPRVFYLARQSGPSPAEVAAVCLAEAGSGTMSCGTGGTTTGFHPGEAKVVPDGQDVSRLLADGWTRVHGNLLVRDFTDAP